MSRPALHLVRLCYRMDELAWYGSAKAACRRVLDDPRSRIKPMFDLCMAGLVLLSVWLLVREVRVPPGPAAVLFEDLIIALFVAEYLLRAWVHDDLHRIVIAHHQRSEFLGVGFTLVPVLREAAAAKWRYATSPMAVIDLLAIVPTYRPLRVLRILLLFRVFKLFRYVRSISELAAVLTEKRFEFLTLAIFLGFVTLASSTALYLFEGGGPEPTVTDFFEAVYWSLVTITTVGYGDITPKTPEGQAVTMVLIIAGVGFIAMATSIVVAALTERLGELRENRVLGELEKLRDFTVVCGYGRVGQVVVERLHQEGLPFVVIERDEERAERARKRGFLVVRGDASSNDLLASLSLGERARDVVCTTHDDVANVFICLSARHAGPHLRIIARANSHQSVRKLTLAGADHVVAPFKAVGLMAAEYVGRPVAFEAIHGILRGERDVVIEAVPVTTDSFIEGATVEDVDLDHYKVVLFGVARDGDPEEPETTAHAFVAGDHRFFFNPPGSFRLQAGDVMLLFGHEYSLDHFRRALERARLRSAEATG